MERIGTESNDTGEIFISYQKKAKWIYRERTEDRLRLNRNSYRSIDKVICDIKLRYPFSTLDLTDLIEQSYWNQPIERLRFCMAKSNLSSLFPHGNIGFNCDGQNELMIM